MKLPCPQCGESKSKVVKCTQNHRHRKCLACSCLFYTREQVVCVKQTTYSVRAKLRIDGVESSFQSSTFKHLFPTF